MHVRARVHKEIVFDDGKRHHLSLTEPIDSDMSPWLIPDFVEELELSGEKYTENWIET